MMSPTLSALLAKVENAPPSTCFTAMRSSRSSCELQIE
jgi:hypothetical protein